MRGALAGVTLGTGLILIGMWFGSGSVHAAAPCHGQLGEASWYGIESGNRTASGAYFDGSSMTAAMPSRSMMGKRVRVTDMRTGRSIVVLVNDLGPAAWTQRVIDLSRAAARALGMGGLAFVCVSAQ